MCCERVGLERVCIYQIFILFGEQNTIFFASKQPHNINFETLNNIVRKTFGGYKGR